MRKTTEVWIKMESAGQPGETKTINAQLGDGVFEVMKWLLSPGLYLQTGITIKIVRHARELMKGHESKAQEQSDQAEWNMMMHAIQPEDGEF